MGTLHRCSGFYTVQTVFSITLHLTLPLTGNFLLFQILTSWFSWIHQNTGCSLFTSWTHMNATTIWESVLADLESSTHQEQFSDMSCSFRECELIITKGDLEYTEDLPMSSAGNKNSSPLLFIIYLSVNVKFTVAYSYFKGRFHLTERLCFPSRGIPNRSGSRYEMKGGPSDIPGGPRLWVGGGGGDYIFINIKII